MTNLEVFLFHYFIQSSISICKKDCHPPSSWLCVCAKDWGQSDLHVASPWELSILSNHELLITSSSVHVSKPCHFHLSWPVPCWLYPWGKMRFSALSPLCLWKVRISWGLAFNSAWQMQESWISHHSGRVKEVCAASQLSLRRVSFRNFPGDPVVGTLTPNAGGTGLIPGQGAVNPQNFS